MILIEENFNGVVPLVEAAKTGKKMYLKGVFARSETKNLNGRIYDKQELTEQVNLVNEKAKLGRYVLGHLDHSSDLEIRLEDVSHKIVEMWMEGNDAYGKAEIIEFHPKGQILKALIESGVNVGVSTRGAGQVNESTGRVTGFTMITVDAVAVPSASAYPDTVMEQLMMDKRGGVITELSEAVLHDPIAQKYFQAEIRKFIERLTK